MKRLLTGLLPLLCAGFFVVVPGCSEPTPEGPYIQRPAGQLTYAKHIAPILFEECSDCHRPGGGAPFDLLTYEDARRRAGQIAFVVEDRYMPPWLPAEGHGSFVGERRLSEEEIGMISQWVDEGSPEGEAADLPAAPTWSTDWALGAPDLILELPEPFELAAGGPDVYRNFVLSVPLEKPVFVRALDFHPGNPRVVHHSFVQLDPTTNSRELDEQSPGPGFGDLTDMLLPESVTNPGDGGFFHGWNPGKRPFEGYDDMAWELSSSYDVVLQLHMQPSGKVEQVQPKIAFYFAEAAPTRFPLVIGLRSAFLDIPAGEEAYSFERHLTLPVDVNVLGVMPHAHYIGKHLMGFAMLPNGKQQWLIDIPDWDFNWQGDYRYDSPVFLPKGSKITQRYTYDNSSSNPRNPVSPPVRVRVGGNSVDEMGELWLQVLTTRPRDRAVLQQHFQRSLLGDATKAAERQLGVTANEAERNALQVLKDNPSDWAALLDMAKARGYQNRIEEALDYAQRSIQSAPGEAEPHCMFGHLQIGRDDELAFTHLTEAIRIRPDILRGHLSLGMLWKRRGAPDKAEQCFLTALQIVPDDPLVLYNLGLLTEEQGKLNKAAEIYRRTLKVEPRFQAASEGLQRIQGKRQQRRDGTGR